MGVVLAGDSLGEEVGDGVSMVVGTHAGRAWRRGAAAGGCACLLADEERARLLPPHGCAHRGVAAEAEAGRAAAWPAVTDAEDVEETDSAGLRSGGVMPGVSVTEWLCVWSYRTRARWKQRRISERSSGAGVGPGMPWRSSDIAPLWTLLHRLSPASVDDDECCDEPPPPTSASAIFSLVSGRSSFVSHARTIAAAGVALV